MRVLEKGILGFQAIFKRLNGRAVHSIHLFFFFIFLLIVCTKNESVKPWLYFPDNFDYLEQSKHDFSDPKLYSPERTGLTARPFTVPLIYKITGSDFFTFMSFQTAFYCICVFLFVASLLSFLQNLYLKMFFIPILYFLFSWWNIVGWSSLGVSELITFCFLLLWLSTLLLFLSRKTLFFFMLHLLVSILHSFARDTWPYLIVLTPFLLALFYFREKRFLLRYLTSYLLFAVALYFVQQKTIETGQRYRLSVFNTIFIRLSGSPEYMEWFKKEGLPQTERISQEFRNIDIRKQEDILKLYKAYENPDFAPVFDWIVTKGKNSYMKFLLTHPGYLLLSDQTKEEKERIFAYSLALYTGPPAGYYVIPDTMLPFFKVWMVLLLCCLVFVMHLKSKGADHRLVFPLFLLLLGIANAYLSYNADSLEVERHLFFTRILSEIIGWTCVFLIADFLIRYFKEKRKPATESIPAKD